MLYLLDNNHHVQFDPRADAPKAWLPINATAVAISADGSRIAFITQKAGPNQLQVWTWSTGAITTVSTN